MLDIANLHASVAGKPILNGVALDDRQKALNDKRMLEGIREDAMDSMRRYFLMNCPAGGKETAR